MSLVVTNLTDKIDEAFADEWRRQKTIPLPSAGAEDRRLLFAAVARGVLEYLKANEDDIFKSISVRQSGGDETTWTVEHADLDVVS